MTESTNSTKQSINDSVTATTLLIRTKNALHISGLRQPRQDDRRQQHIGWEQDQRPESAEQSEALHRRNGRHHNEE